MAGGAAVDEPLVDREQVVGIDAEAATRVGEQVGEEHVGAGDQVVEHLLAVRRVDTSSADAALAAVQDLPHELHADVAFGQPARSVCPSSGRRPAGGTTLMTSAPQSASTAAADGANAYIESSTTRTPSSRS